jgi:hypothetical protein
MCYNSQLRFGTSATVNVVCNYRDANGPRRPNIDLV